jgi:hypothetical protein
MEEEEEEEEEEFFFPFLFWENENRFAVPVLKLSSETERNSCQFFFFFSLHIMGGGILYDQVQELNVFVQLLYGSV